MNTEHNQRMTRPKPYNNELEGQADFLGTYLPRIDSSLSREDIQNDYSDGVIGGCIIEFKLYIDDLNAVLFQSVKYLSSMRVKGKPVPANILLVALNARTAYLYRSEDYLPFIERLYNGGASKDNTGFVCGSSKDVFHYTDELQEERMIAVMKTREYTKIHIDENCIVGWATSYYRQYPQAKKSDFIGDYMGKVHVVGEIRKPDKFKEYIHPYTEKSNEKFRYLMDKLNDTIQKKNLGSFYTHELYAEKSLELVREAVRRVPSGNDYIILDRCAGTGNLELHMTEEELSHVIVSTLEYYEYKVLVEVLGDKVRHIVPPTEKEDTFNMGMVRGADALSREYVENSLIRSYIDDPNVTVILFENPPYAETTSMEHQRAGKARASSVWKESYVVQEMRKEIRGVAVNDLANAFIWSAFKYYLRQPTDSYIVYSPVKYWKTQHLIDREFLGGFAFNRRHFHTNIDACIMVAHWGGCKVTNSELSISAYDIEEGKLTRTNRLLVSKVHERYSARYYDKDIPEDAKTDGILVGLNGLESDKAYSRIRPLVHPDIIGYMVAKAYGFDNPDASSSLLVAGKYDGNGFFLKRSNYMEKLPMFAASRYITYNRSWTERGRVMKSADGYEKFFREMKSKDGYIPFLYKCLLFCMLEPQNHMRTFRGSDGRMYINELCMDDTNGQPQGMKDLMEGYSLSQVEQRIVDQWKAVLEDARKTAGYNPEYTYGLYQIKCELNTSYKDPDTEQTVYDYPSLNGNIKVLAGMVKEYYLNEIVPTLFYFEFLK